MKSRAPVLLPVAALALSALAPGATAQETRPAPSLTGPARHGAAPATPLGATQKLDGRVASGTDAGGDVATTSLFVLAAIADGSTLRTGPRREGLKKAINWLNETCTEEFVPHEA